MRSELIQSPARLVLPLVTALLVAAPLTAQQPTPQPAPEQREHLVRRGDTLWDLARSYLGNPFLWPSIFDANRAVVENPHWIYPAERLLIPPVLQTTVRDAVPPQPVWTPPSRAPEVADAVAALVMPAEVSRPAVQVTEYLSAPYLSGDVEERAIGRVVELRDPARSGGRLPATIHPWDQVVVGRLTGTRPAQGDSLLLVRLGRRVGGDRLVEPLAVLRVDTIGAALIATIVQQFGEAREGDVVIPMHAVPAIGPGPGSPVQDGPQGHLLQFVAEQSLYGTTDLGFVSLGASSGIGIGDEFAVYVPARQPEGRMGNIVPPRHVATVRVVKVMDRTATVRVVEVTSTALRGGLPVQLVRRLQ